MTLFFAWSTKSSPPNYVKGRATERRFVCGDGRCLLFVHIVWSHSWLKHRLKEHIKPFPTLTQCHFGCSLQNSVLNQWPTHPEPWLHELGDPCCCPPSPYSKWGFPVPYNPHIPLTVALCAHFLCHCLLFKFLPYISPLHSQNDLMSLIMQVFAVGKYTGDWLIGLSSLP